MKTNDSTPQRNSSYELLRIIMMILIVAHHFSFYGRFDFSTESVGINRLWIQLLELGGLLGIDVFVLISGYFLIDSVKFKTERLVRIWFQMFTYSIAAFFGFVLAGKAALDIKGLVKAVFPVTFGFG